MYSYHCLGASHLFGCIGIKNRPYCILNKQYTKEEYEALIPRIIEHMVKTGEWGELFPSSISPFGYNETVAQEYYPMIKEEALQEGFNWSDYEAPFPKVEKIIPASKLPNDISKIPDDVLNWAIECEVTKKPFRIVPQELAFYRKHNLPIPRRHPDQRHLDRIAMKNPWKLFVRSCDCSSCEQYAQEKGIPLREISSSVLSEAFPSPHENDAIRRADGTLRRVFATTYAPDRPEHVYCGVCYLKTVL